MLRQLIAGVFVIVGMQAVGVQADPTGYTVSSIDGPAGVTLEVTGLQLLEDGTLVVGLRRGDVWFLKGETWTRFASGMQEMHGLVADSAEVVYVQQRSELTRLVDEDGDGKADLYHRFSSGWGYIGSYHEFAIGLVRDKAGNFFVNLGLGLHTKNTFKGRWLGTSVSSDRGWLLKIDKTGKWTRHVVGLRAPNGLALSAKEELFTTDNQGSFMSAGMLMHAEAGDFLGHPDGLLWDTTQAERVKTIIAMPQEERLKVLNDMRKRPVVHIPYTNLGRSCGHPAWIPEGDAFGPFGGQMVIPDVIQSLVMRVTMDKVEGQYQGACYQFLNDGSIGGGGNRILFDEEGAMYLGQTARGWGRGAGLKKIVFSGKAPFSLKRMTLKKGGFDLEFTEPIDPATCAIGNFTLSTWRYGYTHSYGAPKHQQGGLVVTAADLQKDGKTVSIAVDGLKEDFVAELRCKGLKGSGGDVVSHDGYALYSMNKLVK